MLSPVPPSNAPRRLIVHAGLPKTGSTSVQKLLFENAHLLEAQGIHFVPTPDQPGAPNHNLLALAFGDSVKRVFRRRYGNDLAALKRDSRGAWLDLRNDFDASGKSTLLLSGEFFSGSDPTTLLPFVRGLFGPIEITTVFYLRRPSALFASHLQQKAKGNPKIRNLQRFKQASMLAPWSNHGNLILRELHKDRLVDGDVRKDLAQLVGIDTSDFVFPPRANESVSAEGIELLLQHRRFNFPDAPAEILPQSKRLLRMIRDLEEQLPHTFSKPALLPDFATYLDTDEEDLRELKARFGFEYAGLRVRKGSPDNPALESHQFERVREILEFDRPAFRRLRKALERRGFAFNSSSEQRMQARSVG